MAREAWSGESINLAGDVRKLLGHEEEEEKEADGETGSKPGEGDEDGEEGEPGANDWETGSQVTVASGIKRKGSQIELTPSKKPGKENGLRETAR